MRLILYEPYKSSLSLVLGTILLGRYSSTRRIGWITGNKSSLPAQPRLSEASLLLPQGTERSSNSSTSSPCEITPTESSHSLGEAELNGG